MLGRAKPRWCQLLRLSYGTCWQRCTASQTVHGSERRMCTEGPGPLLSDASPALMEQDSPLAKHIKDLIMFGGGPITVAKFMSEVLTNPHGGYYTNRTVFGAQGDFVTSPEISQLFGEMVGVWCLSLWHDLGRPPRIRLVELGPGRGTLLADLLRALTPFTHFLSALELHLVEVSPALREKQAAALGCEREPEHSWKDPLTCVHGRQVRWHDSLDDVPQGVPAMYIAQEFFDALPVHQFQRTAERGWCERLVDVEEGGAGNLRLVLSPGATVAAHLLLRPRMMALPPSLRQSLSSVEVSPEAIRVAGELARRVHEDDGAALVVDYGQDGPSSDSLRAIRCHQHVPLLEEPGLADLSANVDFDALRYGVRQKGLPVACHGPILQTELLQGLGIIARLEALLEAAGSDEERQALISGAECIVGTGEGPKQEEPGKRAPERMGSIYKAFCLSRQDRPPPIPFRMQ